MTHSCGQTTNTLTHSNKPVPRTEGKTRTTAGASSRGCMREKLRQQQRQAQSGGTETCEKKNAAHL